MSKIRFVLAAFLMCLSVDLHAEASCRHIPRLDVDKGKLIRFSGNLLRYQQKCWCLPMKTDQHLQITLNDNNGRAAIVVYKPGAIIKYGSGHLQDKNPANYYYGETIRTAPAYGTARQVKDEVKGSGNYLMVVGLTSGAGSESKGTVKAE